MNNKGIVNDHSSESIITGVLHKYFPFWPLLLLFLSTSFFCAYYYLRIQTPIFVAASKVLLKDPQKGSDTKVLDALNIFSEKKIVENEIIVLRSTSLMKEVVKSLDLYNAIYKQGKVRKEELFGDHSPIRFIAMDKDNIKFVGVMSFIIDWDKALVRIGNRNFKFGAVFKIEGDVYSIEINKNYKPQNKQEAFISKFNTIESVASSLLSSLTAVPLSYASTVIDVRLESPVPEKGYLILSKLFDVYNKAGIDDKNQMASKTLYFIQDRLKSVTAQLDTIEKNIEQYKTKYAVKGLGSQSEMYLENVRELDKSNGIINIQLQLLDDLTKYVDVKYNKRGTVPSLFMLNDETLKSLLDQLYSSEFELEKVKKTAGEKSDMVLLAQQKISKLKSDIRESISNVKNNILVQKRNNDNKIDDNKSIYATIPAIERGLLGISREQVIINNIYAYLLQKREETAMSSASTSADLRLLEIGYSNSPIRPVPKNYYWVALILGMLVFVLYVFIVEKFKNKIMFRHDIENNTKTPVIGEILQSKSTEPIAITDGNRSVIAEQFRALRTNLSFMGFNEKHKSLLVTSSISGEGKSYVSVNLAISLSLTGKKVALLELDLRKPKLSPVFQVAVSPGISNYLVNKASVDEIVKATPIDHLFLVSAGNIPPNPSELIGKPEFEKLLLELKNRFDFLIIDSAPIAPVTDAQLIASFCDVSLFVVRHNYTPKHFIKLIEACHKENKFNNMGVVFNGIKPRGASIFNYGFGGYGNGYGDGYGYGYNYGRSYSGYYVNDKSQPGYKNFFKIFTSLFGLIKNK